MTEPISIKGQEYKIGFRGKVYAKRNDEWALSANYSVEDIHLAHEKTLKRKYRKRS